MYIDFMREDSYKFRLSLKGDLVENSVDAQCLAYSILSTNQIFSSIADINYQKDLSNNIRININAFRQGSFVSEFLVYVLDNKENLQAMLPILPESINIGLQMMDSFRSLINVREFLKGKPPKGVDVKGDGVVVIRGDNNKVNITMNDFKVLQDKSVQKSLGRIIDPLKRDDSDVTGIEFSGSDEGGTIININKDNFKYFDDSDIFQVIPEISYKGIVSKIDTKARSGFLNINNKRLSFLYGKNLPKEQFEVLVESLKTQVQIVLRGEVSMDYESNPRNMAVAVVEHDVKLFD